MSSKKHEKADRGWLKDIVSLREGLGLTKAQLAAELDVSPVAVSHWDSGRSEPSAAMYIKLGNRAAKSEMPELALRFWQGAGISPESVSFLAPAIRDLIEKRVAGKAAMVPILRSVAYIDAPTLAPPSEVEQWIALPASVVKVPATMSCLRVPHGRVRSFFSEGDILMIDAAERNPENLWGGMVAANYAPGEDEVREHEYGPRAGLHVGVLRRGDLGEGNYLAQLDSSMLNLMPAGAVAQAEAMAPVDKHDFRDSAVVIAIRLKSPAYIVQPSWRILGRVAGWFSSSVDGREDVAERKPKRKTKK